MSDTPQGLEDRRRSDGKFGTGRTQADNTTANERADTLDPDRELPSWSTLDGGGYNAKYGRSNRSDRFPSTTQIPVGTHHLDARTVSSRARDGVAHPDGGFTYYEGADAYTVQPRGRVRKAIGLGPKVRKATTVETMVLRSALRDRSLAQRNQHERDMSDADATDRSSQDRPAVRPEPSNSQRFRSGPQMRM